MTGHVEGHPSRERIEGQIHRGAGGRDLAYLKAALKQVQPPFLDTPEKIAVLQNPVVLLLGQDQKRAGRFLHKQMMIKRSGRGAFSGGPIVHRVIRAQGIGMDGGIFSCVFQREGFEGPYKMVRLICLSTEPVIQDFRQ